VGSAEPEIRLVLAGKRRLRRVLADRARAHGDAAAKLFVCADELASQRALQLAALEETADLRGSLRLRLQGLGAREELADRPGEASPGDELAVGVRADRDPGRDAEVLA